MAGREACAYKRLLSFSVSVDFCQLFSSSGLCALFNGDRDLLYDLQAKAFEGGDVHGGVGKQTMC